MENIFGVVILYHPEENFIDNIFTYLPLLQKIIIIDNSEPSISISPDKLPSNCILIADGQNRGIAERLNTAARLALQEGAGWLLTMDQDSFFDKIDIEAYKNCFLDYNEKKNVSIFGVNSEVQKSSINCKANLTSELITSGSIVNLSIYQKIGGFDEQLFIDEIDHEYCYRSIVNKYIIIKFDNVFMHHNLGITKQFHSLKNFKKSNRILHSPLRAYYILRNYLYVKKKYAQVLPEIFKRRQPMVMNMIKNNLLYGENKLQLLRYLFLAYRHFQKGIMGKFNPVD